MEEIIKEPENPKSLEGYKLNKIDEKKLCEFMHNPFERATYFRNLVLQKYTVDIFVDEVVAIGNSKLQNLAFVDYLSKKVYTQYGFEDLLIEGFDDSFVTISSMIKAVAKITADAFNKAKVDRLHEIEDKPIYDILYTKDYNIYFQQIVFSRIVGEAFRFPLRSVTEISSMNFARKLKLVDLVNIIDGNYEKIEPFVEDVIFSQNFIEGEVVFKKIKKEADDYFEAGHFNQRELKFKYYTEKVKVSGLKHFEATLTDGTIVQLKNAIFLNGKVRFLKDRKASIDFEMIKTIEHDGKIVYAKDLF